MCLGVAGRASGIEAHAQAGGAIKSLAVLVHVARDDFQASNQTHGESPLAWNLRLGEGAEKAVVAEEILRVNRKTLYEAIRLDQVPGVARIGKTLRIRRAALLEWTAGKGP